MKISRKTFELKEIPIAAHCSFGDTERFSLYINGNLVSSGTGIYPCAIMNTVDIKPFLKAGKNTIAFGREFLSWNKSACKPSLLFEGVCVGRDGSLTRILGDESWKSSVKKENLWFTPEFNDSAWAKPELSDKIMLNEMFNGSPVFNGVNPEHMGMLKTFPAGRKYPVFLGGEKVEFKAEIPAGAKNGSSISLDVCKGGTDELIETVSGVPLADSQDWASWSFTSKVSDSGAYRMIWKLSKDGNIIETKREEFVIAGPIKQDEIALEDFEKNFESRLKLITKFDCTKPAPSEGEFIDHSGMYNAPAMNRGKVVSSGGLSYRETGLGRWDYFAYRLHLRERGVPYLVEIVVPDDKDRYIYSCISENYPVGFFNNVTSGSTGWFTASGTAFTGVRYPLSGATKKLRYIFYPQSFNSSVIVMSGFGGFPAAATEINIYKIEGGLPALKVPESDRMFGSHNERMTTMRLTTGMSESPLEFDRGLATTPHKDAYFNWYNTIARKIALMRFQGYNMSIEGIYMYREGDSISLKHHPRVGDGEKIDPVDLMIKMYNSNKIKILLGFEYISSPQVYIQGKAGISERRVWAGEKSTRLVDRYGRQLCSYMNGGYNFLNPDISAIMFDCLSGLYDRYQGSGKVEGLFLVNGYWWLPSFNSGAYPELTDLEVGYDDDSVNTFEKDTGIKLGIDSKDEKRFQKRYELINSKYLQDWLLWRAKKMKEAYSKIETSIQNRNNKWKLFQFPLIGKKQNSPFMNQDSRRAERDSFVAERYKDFGLIADWYKDKKGSQLIVPLSTWSKFGSPSENYDYVYGWNKNPGTSKMIEEFGAFYADVCNGLDEVDCPATAAKKWLFSNTARGVFTPRAAEDCAMNEFVDGVTVSKVPMIVIDQWLDCNLETGFGAQVRRFAKSFYVTPDLKFSRLPVESAKGVFAQTAKYSDGSLCLRLINNSPYSSTGSIKSSGELRDMVYDRNLEAALLSGGKYKLELLPFDVRIIRIEKAKTIPEIEFTYSESIEKELASQSQFILKQDFLLRKVPGDMVARLYDGIARKDGFALWTTMDDFEVLANVRAARLMIKGIDNQKALVDDISSKGSGFINCGAETAAIDRKGRRWLPDQVYKGPEAYGNIGGNPVTRGEIEIKDDVAPAVYRTEIYAGKLQYIIPLPPGNYKLKFHFAETFIGNSKPGMRLFSVEVNGKMIEKKVDILAQVGEHYKPYILETKDISPSTDGLVKIEMLGNVCLNGIEVEKCK